MKRKTALIIAACVVLVGGLAAASFALWPSSTEKPAVTAHDPAPEPSAEKPQDAIKYMASESFEKLDDKAKKEYFDLARETSGARGFGLRGRGAGLTEEERQRLRQNVRPLARKAREKRFTAYFELPAEEKTAHLDKIIDRMQAGREARAERRQERAAAAKANAEPAPAATDNNSPRRGGHRRRFTPERMRRRIETTEPEQRARFVQFMKDIRARAKERGIELRHPHRRSSR